VSLSVGIAISERTKAKLRVLQARSKLHNPMARKDPSAGLGIAGQSGQASVLQVNVGAL
jgi:hypothetical protein